MRSFGDQNWRVCSALCGEIYHHGTKDGMAPVLKIRYLAFLLDMQNGYTIWEVPMSCDFMKAHKVIILYEPIIL